MNFSLAFSPCPNDTFIFDALVNQKIDTDGLIFNPILQDVESLNKAALKNEAVIAKISFAVLPKLLTGYKLLNSGSALGSGVGPLLICRQPVNDLNVTEEVIALPGENTTAHFLFSLAYPEAQKKVFLPYDEIENFVFQGKGLGVIIHENRFTYQQKGLHQVKDLGTNWEAQTGFPIPLGGIVIKRNIDIEMQQKIDRLIQQSIHYAYNQFPILNEYITSNAQEMSEEVMRKHIELYVNEYSLSLGEAGKGAVKKMLQVMDQNILHKWTDEEIFV